MWSLRPLAWHSILETLQCWRFHDRNAIGGPFEIVSCPDGAHRVAESNSSSSGDGNKWIMLRGPGTLLHWPEMHARECADPNGLTLRSRCP
jgi:hypothetical protein